MRNLRRLVLLAAVVGFSFVIPVWAGSVSAAKSRIMQAQDYADKGQKDDALAKLSEAETFLDGLSDDEKAPIVKDIAALRAKLGSTVDPEVSGRIQRNVERYLTVAEGDADSSPQNAATELGQAVDALNSDDAKQNLNPDIRQKLQARIDELQAKINSRNMSAEGRRFADRVENSVRAANENAGNAPDFSRRRLDEAASLLASDEAKQKLDADAVQRLQGSIDQAEANLAASNKKAALDRATPLLKALEDRVATDPFKDVQPISAYQVTDELQALTSRIRAQLNSIPPDDADRKACEDRLAAAQKKIDDYDAALTASNAEAGIVNRWAFFSAGFQGWEQESYDPSGRAFEKPVLPKTEAAAQQSKLFLAEKETAAARQKPADLPKAAAAIAEAEKTASAAEAKLDAAFNQWMDAAEKQPRPQGPNRFDIGAAADMARWADDRLAGSQFHDADVARAKKLDQRWQDELAAIKQQHEAALRQMTADANDAWPKIESSISAEDDFQPADVSSLKGKTFRFKRIRNRSGWDFDGRYDLVMWVKGQPVAGTYEPKIRKAFAEAAGQIGDGVDDHIDWDVIATIEGTGIANQRYTTEVKDEMQNVLGKLEGTRPVTCVIVRVIAVHAGPVAVSGK